jgi:hypothetical protein
VQSESEGYIINVRILLINNPNISGVSSAAPLVWNRTPTDPNYQQEMIHDHGELGIGRRYTGLDLHSGVCLIGKKTIVPGMCIFAFYNTRWRRPEMVPMRIFARNCN